MRKSKRVYYGGASSSKKKPMTQNNKKTLKQRLINRIGGLPRDRGLLDSLWRDILIDKQLECNRIEAQYLKRIIELENENRILIDLLNK